MKSKPITELRAHGVRCLLSPHPRIRRLKQHHRPDSHGNKVWKSCWMLMDYLDRNGTFDHGVALDIGCGWGLSGIFLNKRFNTKVIGVDIDPQIQPYLQLHARINQAPIQFVNKSYDQIRAPMLQGVDIMVGSDICFWEELIEPLQRLLHRARRAKVKQIYLADPGRPTFEDLAELFLDRRYCELHDWEIENPVYVAGKILKLEFKSRA